MTQYPSFVMNRQLVLVTAQSPEDWEKVDLEQDPENTMLSVSPQPVVAICFPKRMLKSVISMLGRYASSAFFAPLEDAHATIRLPRTTIHVSFEHDTVIVAISWNCPGNIIAALGAFGIEPFLLRPEDWRRLSRDCGTLLTQNLHGLTFDRLGPCALSILEPFLRCANLPPISGLGMLGLTAKSVAGRCLHSVLWVAVNALKRANLLPK